MEMRVQGVRLQMQRNGQAGCAAVLHEYALESASQAGNNVCMGIGGQVTGDLATAAKLLAA